MELVRAASRRIIDFMHIGLSVKWANQNLGDYNSGDFYYSFGMPESYYKGTYSEESYHSPIGYRIDEERSIIATQEDPAYCFSKNMRLPTIKEVDELIRNKFACWCVVFKYTNGIGKEDEYYHKELRVFLGEHPFACTIETSSLVIDRVKDIDLPISAECLDKVRGKLHLKLNYRELDSIEPSYLAYCPISIQQIHWNAFCNNEIPFSYWERGVNKSYSGKVRGITFPFTGIMEFNKFQQTDVVRKADENGNPVWRVCFPCGNMGYEYAFYNIAYFDFSISKDSDKYILSCFPGVYFSTSPWEGMVVRAVENNPERPPLY